MAWAALCRLCQLGLGDTRCCRGLMRPTPPVYAANMLLCLSLSEDDQIPVVWMWKCCSTTCRHPVAQTHTNKQYTMSFLLRSG